MSTASFSVSSLLCQVSFSLFLSLPRSACRNVLPFQYINHLVLQALDRLVCLNHFHLLSLSLSSSTKMNRFSILFFFSTIIYAVNSLPTSNGASMWLKSLPILTDQSLLFLDGASNTNGKLNEELTCKTDDGRSKIFIWNCWKTSS